MGKYKILAIIPARAGSKGLPKKNSMVLNGKPLISWTIDAALDSSVFSQVVVSTDCPKLAEIANQCGANVPFLRPASLSTDSALTSDVIIHALEHFKCRGSEFDIVVLLQPTSPLRTSDDILRALEYFVTQKDKSSLVSVCEAPSKIGWLLSEADNGRIRFCFEVSPINLSRQNLPRYFLPNGAIFISWVRSFFKEQTFYTENSVKFLMPAERSIDIDTQEDFVEAERQFLRV